MIDKARYNETRFAGEHNAIYDGEGTQIEGGYREAYQRTSQAADKLAEENLKGRNRGRAYVYDSTINPGAGRLSNEAAHRLVEEFRAEITSRGYKLEGMQYAIHQGTEHTHIHTIYALHKTLQLKELRSMQEGMRHHTERIQSQEASHDLRLIDAQEQERDRGGITK